MKTKKPKKTKFEVVFGRYESINPKYYQIAKEYKDRLKSFTELCLSDIVYSDYIKITKSVKGICTCVTCGSQLEWNKRLMQNGHFHKRKDYKYRFMDENCRPQCRTCNCALDGNYVNYTDFIAHKLFGGDHTHAITMYNDDDFVIVSKTEQRDLVVDKWYPEIQRTKQVTKV